MSAFVTAAMQAHATVLLARSARWARGIDNRSHRAFVCFSSSRVDREGQPIYWRTAVDGSLCSCTGWLHRGICAHAVACKAEAERAREAVARKPTHTYEELYGSDLTDAF